MNETLPAGCTFSKASHAFQIHRLANSVNIMFTGFPAWDYAISIAMRQHEAIEKAKIMFPDFDLDDFKQFLYTSVYDWEMALRIYLDDKQKEIR